MCSTFNARDVTAAALSGALHISLAATSRAQRVCPRGEKKPESYALSATATLTLALDNAPHSNPVDLEPTLAPRPPTPTTTMPFMSPPENESTAFVNTTFTQLQSSLHETMNVEVHGFTSFESQLYLTSTNRTIFSRESAVFDGSLRRTSLLVIVGTNLSIENISLQNGLFEGGLGGCLRATWSVLRLKNVLVQNCVARFGGGFYMDNDSLLHASKTRFESNSAVYGGSPASFSFSSLFTNQEDTNAPVI